MANLEDARTLTVTIDGEPADRRTLELLEKGIEALKAQWDETYATLANELPSASDTYIPKVTFDYIIAHGDELIRLTNLLYEAKAERVKQLTYGPAEVEDAEADEAARRRDDAEAEAAV